MKSTDAPPPPPDPPPNRLVKEFPGFAPKIAAIEEDFMASGILITCVSLIWWTWSESWKIATTVLLGYWAVIALARVVVGVLRAWNERATGGPPAVTWTVAAEDQEAVDRVGYEWPQAEERAQVPLDGKCKPVTTVEDL